MKMPCYIILRESGERFDLHTNDHNPNEFTLGERLTFAYDPEHPNESKLFEVDDPNDPDRAVTLPFELYANDGTLLAKDERSIIFWV